MDRPDFSKESSMIVWNMAKRQRDESRAIAEASDILMQAIEAAPELDMAMQKSFRLQQQPPPPPPPPAPPGGYKGGAPR